MNNNLYEGKTDHDLLIMIHTTLDGIDKRVSITENTLYSKPDGICAEMADIKGKYKTIVVIGVIALALLPAGMWIFDKIIR